MSVCVCVCDCEREREGVCAHTPLCVCVYVCVCVCVCVCVWFPLFVWLILLSHYFALLGHWSFVVFVAVVVFSLIVCLVFSALDSAGVYLLLLLCRFECMCHALCLNLNCLLELFWAQIFVFVIS